MLKLKLQCFGHLRRRTNSIGKDPDAGKDWRQGEKGTTQNERVGWHHWLNEHVFEQVPGAGDGQGSLVYCSPWGCKESDMSERLNWTDLNWYVRREQKRQEKKSVEKPQKGKLPKMVEEQQIQRGWNRKRLRMISRVDNGISLNCELLREKHFWGCQERGKLGGSQEMNLFRICQI